MSVNTRGQLQGCHQASAVVEPSQPSLWFKRIPPERVGLDGEYDYYGLAKRVWACLCEALGVGVLQTLSVDQRGRVIVLSGVLPSRDVAQHLIQIVSCFPGVDAVEAQAVRVETEMLISA